MAVRPLPTGMTPQPPRAPLAQRPRCESAPPTARATPHLPPLCPICRARARPYGVGILRTHDPVARLQVERVVAHVLLEEVAPRVAPDACHVRGELRKLRYGFLQEQHVVGRSVLGEGRRGGVGGGVWER